jgi:hypothetical protein
MVKVVKKVNDDKYFDTEGVLHLGMTILSGGKIEQFET